MRYQAFSGNIGETVYVGSKFLTGETVTVTVYNMATGSSVTLTTGTASEIGSTGFFVWPSSDITTQPTSYTSYLVIFEDSTGYQQAQKFVAGGFPDQIAFAEYNGVVYVDPTSGNSGTDFPNGTRRQPVDNMADARSIAVTNGINQFNITGSISLNAADYSGFRFMGNDPLNDALTVTSATDLSGAVFILTQITGTITMGDIFCQNCLLNVVNGFSGVALQSTFTGTNVLKVATMFGTSILRQCFSALDNLLAEPIFSFNSLNTALQLQGYDGSFEVEDMTNASSRVDANFSTGNIVIGATNTAGTATIRGDAQVDDSANGGTTIVDDTTHALTLGVALTEHDTNSESLAATVQRIEDQQARTVAINPVTVFARPDQKAQVFVKPSQTAKVFVKETSP